MQDQEEKISRQRRVGLGLLQILIVLLALGLIYKSLLNSREAAIPSGQLNHYYTLGYEHGTNKAEGKSSLQFVEPNNLVLKKIYRKGFRDGWDASNLK